MDLRFFFAWKCLRSCEEEAIFNWVRVRVGFRQVEIFKKGILCDGSTVSKDLEPGKCKESSRKCR